MRDDLLKQVGRLDQITNTIVLTHNIDFIFLQSVFMTAMKRCGHPNLTVFADAQCAHQSYRHQSRMLTGLGHRFRVVPVAMPTGFRFHPKALLLSGSDRATLFVGSGNLTFGGMRQNAEVWTRFDTENDEGGAFSAFRAYLSDVLQHIALPDAVRADVDVAFDAVNHAWAETLPEPGFLFGKSGAGLPLLDRLAEDLGDTEVNRLVICTPYFDEKATALVELSARVGNPPTQVLIQDRRSTLFAEAAERLPTHIELMRVSYRHRKGNDDSASRFIHAKFYAFRQGNRFTVYSGSANCSRAALLVPGEQGNFELLVRRVMTEEEFESELVGEFDIEGGTPELIGRDALPEEPEENMPAIRLMAVRYDAGELLIGYRASGDVRLTRCLADGHALELVYLNDREAVVHTHLRPVQVSLEGMQGCQIIVSDIHWVDDEELLRTTARGRTLLEGIQRSERSGGWHLEDWSLIVGLLVKDMSYVTPRAMRRGMDSGERNDTSGKMTFSHADVFSSTYDKAPSLGKDGMFPLGRSSFSVHRLLLNAFGIDTHRNQEEADDQVEESENLRAFTKSGSGDDESVDAPEVLKKRPQYDKHERELTAQDRKRIAQLIESIADTLVNPEYIEHRDPRRLGIDLQVIALLLRKAYSKGWVTAEQFFAFTQKVWSELFFHSEVQPGNGWLEYRYRASESPDRFVDEIHSPALDAALFAWADAVPVTEAGPYVARFLLAQCLSMGRMQWLWHREGEDQADVLQRIVDIVVDSPCDVRDSHVASDGLYMRRRDLLRMGAALHRLEERLKICEMNDIRARVSGYPVRKSEPLWQGRRGICLALQDTEAAREYVSVLCLQDPDGEAKFSKEYLVPIAALLDQEVLPDSEGFGPHQREALGEFIAQVKRSSGLTDCP